MILDPRPAHLELVGLEFAVARLGGQRAHVLADGGKTLTLGVEDDRRDQALVRAHRHAHVHRLVPLRKKRKTMSLDPIFISS